MSVRVKICGITREQDAQLAVDNGAAAIGFNFWPDGPRYCPPELAREISHSLPPFITRVGVFVDLPGPEIDQIVGLVGLSAVQLHGSESPQECLQPSVPVIKAIHVTRDLAAQEFARYDVAGFLLDAPSYGYGGSGTIFDWNLVAKLDLQRPVLIAGGLTPANVARAIQTTHPYGVDVASGVEISPGIKDPEKVVAFMNAVRGANQ